MASSGGGGGAQSNMLQQQQQQQQHPYNLQSQPSSAGSSSGFHMMQQQSPAAAPGTGASTQMMSPTKEYNSVNMCHIGQETVHEIVAKAQEIFNVLTPKYIQLPNNQPHQAHHYNEKKKLEELLRQINIHFRKLRVFYAKVNEASDQVPEQPTEKELVPYVGDESEPSLFQADAYRVAVEQHREMVEQVRLKNQELKEIVDSIRSIIWEINTMITMRKTL